MSDKFTIVKKYIDKYDYYSLLNHGAPDDEYLSEAAEISGLISEGSSAKEIAAVIAAVMQKYFGNTENPQKYLDIAIKIKSEL